MNSMEFNKIAGATIGALLLFLLLNFFSGAIYGTRESAHAEGEHGPVLAYAVEIEGDAGGAAVEEPQIDLLALFSEPDAAKGELTFRACGACHSLEAGVNKVGPSLHGVVGQDVAAVDGFAYSDAMAAVEGDWTPEFLFEFLGDPKGVVPGTKMSYAGLKGPEDRVNLIAYLNEQGGAPVDLTDGLEPLAPAGGDKAEAPAGTEVAATDAAATTDASAEGTAGEAAAGAESGVEVTGVTIVDTSKPEVEVESVVPLEISKGDEAATAEQPETVTVTTAEPVTTEPAAETAAVEPVTTEPTAPAPAAEPMTTAPATATAPAGDTPVLPAEETVAAAPGAEAPATTEGQPAAGETEVVAAMPTGDVANGEKLFRRCQACHKVEAGKNGIGPSLHAIVGRDVATVEGYNYSDAMKAHGGAWTPDRLSAYLADPKGVVPGTKMAFAGLKGEQDRTDVITYLQQAGQ